MENSSNQAQVLVTGGSGFIASYCIIALLKAGFKVKASVRSLKRTEEVKAMLRQGGVNSFESLSFVEADLQDAASWHNAVKDCTYVIHTASPTPNTAAKTLDDFVVPARNGVLYVLEAAQKAGVKRVVLTSAFGAVVMGTNKTAPYTEEDWTVLNNTVPPYQQSKSISERAAWEFVRSHGNRMELAVVNPAGVLGPVLSNDYSHSIQPIFQMLSGVMKACPKLSFGYVDVRDVADLHVKAMVSPAANGQRFLAVAGKSMSMVDIANILRRNLGEKAAKVPTKVVPNWFIRVGALFNKQFALVAPLVGIVKSASNDKAKRLLGWQPRSNEEAVLATANSLLDLGLVK
ncbi:nucleoside-diphosphate-sugar epimerase [Chitinophaga skermanii]|uniref:Nucleoside-diphosphate-sugar epimerase n=1 Tax=Chitinophaga skermanii TaxID=331697 RepID=A0A327Q1I9_9BACT|nr:aldehyde reductase [Chitinophaga skermanii]RAI97893.1 nucleoside-diphosphate-sugar epimerase [Chitinophaga skermanii]